MIRHRVDAVTEQASALHPLFVHWLRHRYVRGLRVSLNAMDGLRGRAEPGQRAAVINPSLRAMDTSSGAGRRLL